MTTVPDPEGHAGRQRRLLTATVTDLEVDRQRAFLIGVRFPDEDLERRERSLVELMLLTDTAGSNPVDSEMVRRDRPDPATYIGSGKAKELATLTKSEDIDVVIFNNPLYPAQQRNLQKIFECDVVDREALILDIFAQHAKSREGSLQVELAMLQYHLPRLRGKGQSLSQQAGSGTGIATRGPGETKLETDRRRIRDRIARLKRELTEISQHHQTQRKRRNHSGRPQISIVGYTNAGKSTLLNQITDAGVLAEDRLFATLDSTVRQIDLPGGRQALLSDTVGFISDLPHHLVEAFRSTLNEITEADLIVHVVDGTEPDTRDQMEAVRHVLRDIRAEEILELVVFNKTDVMDTTEESRLRRLHPDAVLVSARTGSGMDTLLQRISDDLSASLVSVSATLPYDRGDLVDLVHRVGEMISEEHHAEGTAIKARIPASHLSRFTNYT